MEALGPVLVLLSIPLALRWIPRNRFYGFRTPATCRDDHVWYAANATCGGHMIGLGLAMVALEFWLPVDVRVPTLRAVGGAGLALVLTVNWRRASRLARRPQE